MIIEGIQYQSNISSFRKLALLQGVLICFFKTNNILFEIIEPSKWKSFCGIKGRARKEQKQNTIEFSKENFNLKDITEDMADAIGLGWYAVNNLKFEEE